MGKAGRTLELWVGPSFDFFQRHGQRLRVAHVVQAANGKRTRQSGKRSGFWFFLNDWQRLSHVVKIESWWILHQPSVIVSFHVISSIWWSPISSVCARDWTRMGLSKALTVGSMKLWSSPAARSPWPNFPNFWYPLYDRDVMWCELSKKMFGTQFPQEQWRLDHFRSF